MKQFNRIIILLLIFLPSVIMSQVGTIKVEKPKPPETKPVKDSSQNEISYFNLYYGYKFFQQDFQGKFNTLQKYNYNKPIQLIGFGLSGPTVVTRSSRNYYCQSLFHIVVPQSVLLNDSIKSKVTGFVYSFGLGGYLITKSKKFYTGFYLGVNTGRLRFYGNEIIRQKNPFFSPKIGIQPKVLIGKLTISLILEAEYDISKTNWRRMTFANKDKINIEQFRQTGITTLLGISYNFIKYAPNTNTTTNGDIY
ncbi:MAG: hypothetical protein ACXVPU_11140 [Bacteroidia bacterium]